MRVEVVTADDGPGRLGLGAEVGTERFEGLTRSHVPAVVAGVAPRVGEVAALEAPLEPAQLDVPEVFEQLLRGPAGWERTAVEGLRWQGRDAFQQRVAEEVQVSQKHLGPVGGRLGRLRE